MKKFEGDLNFLALYKTSALGQLTRATNALLDMEKQGVGAEALKAVRGDIHTLKGDSRMIGLDSIGAAAHAIEDLLSGADAVPRTEADRRVRRILALIDAITLAIDRLPEEVVDINPTAVGAESLLEPEAPPAAAGRGKGRTREKPVKTKTAPPAEPAADKSSETETITLNLRRIEDLIQKSSVFPQYHNKFNFILGQLEKLRSRMEDEPNPAEDAKRLGALVSQLSHELSFYDLGSRQFQSEITKLKLVPLSSIFDQFPRLVRDVAHNTRKSVSLTVKGRDVELDKTVVEQLKTILLHLLRNAVDHGIEPAAERTKAGKPEGGRIVLHAHNRGDMVEIEVGDDGAGINLELVREKAAAQGLVDRRKAAALSDDEVISLIFLSGFSTREVGEFSGRGVGMDVVGRTVRDLNGQIAVKTLRGRGTTFTVTLPLISSFIPVTVFVIGDRLFGLPSSFITSVVRPEERNMSRSADGRLVAAYRTAELSLVDLNAYFGFGRAEGDRSRNILLVRNKDELAGFVVGEVIHEKKMIIRKNDWLTRACPAIIGAVLSGRERAIPVLNVPELLGRLRETAGAVVKLKTRRGEKDFRLKNILLVEDSAVSRTRQRDILEDHDLNVFEAANGKEALALLEKQAFDAVITDLEMPVMNGRELIKRIRERGEFARLPVIVMSSYASGLEELMSFGIHTFIDKTKFTARRLVDALSAEGIE